MLKFVLIITFAAGPQVGDKIERDFPTYDACQKRLEYLVPLYKKSNYIIQSAGCINTVTLAKLP